MPKQVARMVPLACALAVVQGCLPADTRPEPAEVMLTADLVPVVRSQQNAAAQLTFETDDGWTVTIDGLFASLGNARLDGDACNEYASAGYRRILDLRQPGPQKLSQVWGLNGCQVSYSASTPPTVDAVLGSGVTIEEAQLMQSAIVPVSTSAGMTTAQGMALHVFGNAAKAGLSLSFDWGFTDRIGFTDCRRIVDGKPEDHLPLTSDATITVNIAVDPRRLFTAGTPNSTLSGATDGSDPLMAGSSTAADPGSLADAEPNVGPDNSPPANPQPNTSTTATAPIPLMQLMANADQTSGNANGRISMEELSKVKLTGTPSDLSRIAGANSNLAEVMRLSVYPSLFIYADNGQCIINVGQGRGHRGRGM